MIFSYKTESGQLSEQALTCPGNWVHIVSPSKDELEEFTRATGVLPEFLQAALDEEETPRIDKEDEQTLILVDIPVVEPEGTSFVYNTLPLGIVITENNIITVCLEETTIIEDFCRGRVRGFDCAKKTRFVYQLLYKISSRFLQYLRQIDKAKTQVENALQKSLKNRELIQMLKLEKSLVFFSTSLKANEIVMEKMLKTNVLKRYPEDEELLKDVIIENKQAIEMAGIYRDILSGTMDAFASVISNNLNIVMKLLASITIILTIPSIIFGLWGSNVTVPFQNAPWGFWAVIGIAAVTTGASVWLMRRKKWL